MGLVDTKIRTTLESDPQTVRIKESLHKVYANRPTVTDTTFIIIMVLDSGLFVSFNQTQDISVYTVFQIFKYNKFAYINLPSESQTKYFSKCLTIPQDLP